MSETHIFIVPVLTVGKIVLVAFIGIFLSRLFFEPVKSISGFTFISVRVLLPCLLFANLCLEVTWNTLGTYYWGVILSCLPMILGYLLSLLFHYVLNSEWHSVLTLGCTFQNGLLYPLTVIANLKGIQWLSEDGRLDAQRMMFMYNIFPSCGLWAIGETVIRLARQNLDAQSAAASPSPLIQLETNESTEDQPNLHVNDNISTNNSRVELPARDRTGNRFQGCWLMLKRVLSTPPVAGSIIAIAISLIYPLRWIMELPPGKIILGGMKAVGAGCVPTQLLILGCSLAVKRESPPDDNNNTNSSNGNASVATNTVENNRHNENGSEIIVNDASEEEEHHESCLVKVKQLCAQMSQATLFTIITCFLRLVLVPSTCFIIVHVMYICHLLPVNRPFCLALLIGITSPSAVNASLICSLYNYHAKEYARMVFTMYVTAIFTGTIWLMIVLWYIEQFVPPSSN